MIFQVNINNRNYRFNSEKPFDISIPIDFNGAQVNAYGVEKAAANACEAGSLVGDTRRGGSCNFEQYKLIPHCNGTHTESIGHLTHERISIHDCLKDVLIPVSLISIEPERADESAETYSVELKADDKLLTKKRLEKALEETNRDFLTGLIVRSLPNDESQKTRTYLEEIPPFFSLEAVEFIAQIGVRHLLCDLPSIDRIFDEGKLANHRVFWNIEPESFETNEKSRTNNTVTELIFVPETIKDGSYLLNLQIASFVADAAPSRPILFEIVN